MSVEHQTHFHIQTGKGKKGRYKDACVIVGDSKTALAYYDAIDTRSLSANPPKKRLVIIKVGRGGAMYVVLKECPAYYSASVGITPLVIGNRSR